MCSKESEITTAVYKERFLIQILYILLEFTITFQWIQYSIVPGAIKQLYKVDAVAVNWTTSVWYLSYVIAILPFAFFIKKTGLRSTVIYGSLLNLLGTVLKCFSVEEDKFWLTMCGQTLASLSGVLVYSIPTELTATWFPLNEVSTATSTSLAASLLGTAIGFLVPPFMIENLSNQECIKYGLLRIFIGQAIVSLIIFILILIFFKDKPELPPSVAQLKVDQSEKVPTYCSTLKTLSKNRTFVILFVAFGLVKGINDALQSNLGEIISLRFSSHNRIAGIFGLMSMIAAVPGSLLFGYVMDKTHKHKLLILITFVFTLICLIAFSLFLQFQYVWCFAYVLLVNGFFAGGILPLGFEFAAEVTYPIAPTITAGLLHTSYHFFGYIYNIIYAFIMQNYGYMYANYIFVSSIAVALLSSFLIQSSLKRQEANIV
ncbi:putative MFS-type transporter C09D4.1-like protein [Dinothrombium tinctorium]|uniref:Putative MFS-type transporter C09D4.1-like protein n=1 Tax=Dinothrombium tinctorium TaxID=1965070 RepID=A0A443QGW6_9ACAR|nr:putative MFS-type transporter C09D4.1-like protein [Dinothrombium tinctorium]